MGKIVVKVGGVSECLEALVVGKDLGRLGCFFGVECNEVGTGGHVLQADA